MSDRFSLGRFERAQENGGMYERALAELRAGRKRGHWIWFVFPQLSGLGYSTMSRTYAISSLAEASAYLEHPVLGPRLVECARVLTELRGRSIEDVLGAVDAVKLRSSMTLFARVAGEEEVFVRVLVEHFDGRADVATVRLLEVDESKADAARD